MKEEHKDKRRNEHFRTFYIVQGGIGELSVVAFGITSKAVV